MNDTGDDWKRSATSNRNISSSFENIAEIYSTCGADSVRHLRLPSLFLDLVRFDPASGKPTLILNYKTGPAPTAGSPKSIHHAEQPRIYRDALA